MYCPKCGQIAVNLNGRDICTKCGIVFDNDLPREQILNQIRSKMAQQVSSNKESYMSPIALAEKRKNQPKALPKMVITNQPKQDTYSGTQTLEEKIGRAHV